MPAVLEEVKMVIDGDFNGCYNVLEGKNRIRNDANENRPVIPHDDSTYTHPGRSNNAIETQ